MQHMVLTNCRMNISFKNFPPADKSEKVSAMEFFYEGNFILVISRMIVQGIEVQCGHCTALSKMALFYCCLTVTATNS